MRTGVSGFPGESYYMCVSSYYYKCPRTLYKCPRTTIYVSSYYLIRKIAFI